MSRYRSDSNDSPDFKSVGAILGLGAVAGTGAFFLSRWRVAKPHQFLAKSGAFLRGRISFSRSTIQLPFQEIVCVNMHPKTYEFNLHNMSREKVEFKLPVVFTIGPISPEEDPELFLKYCNKINELSSEEIENTIRGMIEGEARTLTAKMSIEEMFSGKEMFRTEVVDKINSDLNNFGLNIYNANIKEMADYDANNKYFEYRKKRAIETANYEAQVDVAKAQQDGESKVSKEESVMRQNKALADREAEVIENQNRVEIANSIALLSEAEALAEKRRLVAYAEAEQEAERRKIELQTEVDRQRMLQQTEAERADQLAKASAKAEAIERLSAAKLVESQNEAKGILAKYEATAEGLEKVMSAAGSDELAKFTLALDKDLYGTLSKNMADGLQGMQPKVTIVDNGGKGEFASPYVNTAAGLMPFAKEFIENLNIGGSKVVMKKKPASEFNYDEILEQSGRN